MPRTVGNPPQSVEARLERLGWRERESRGRLDTLPRPGETIQVTDKQIAAVNLGRDAFHPEWNYTISPTPQSAGELSTAPKSFPCVDRIGHDHILTMIGAFPARWMVRAWLKAGVVENGRLFRTEEGTPQGG
jgi:hypothetical protein